MASLTDLFQYQDVTGPVFIPAAAGAPDLSWHPTYPDKIDRKEFLADQQLFYTANITPEQTIARAWSPSYPDQIDRLTVHPSRIPSEFEPPFSPRDLGHIGWEPEYPDWLDRKTMLANLQQSLALELAARALDHIGWKPEFPDFARAAVPITWQQFLALEPFPRPDVTFVNSIYPDRLFTVVVPPASGETAPPPSVRDLGHTGWYPAYPDWFVYLRAQPASGESSPPSSVQPLGHIAWEPEFPDQIWRITLPTAAMQVEAFDPFPQVAFPPEFLTWQTIKPDFIWPTQGLRHDLQQVFAFWPEPLPNAPAPDLSWDPEYPDQIFRVVLPVGAVPFTWRNVEPVTAMAAPDLSWKPVYPDQIWVKTLYSAHLTVFVIRLDAPAETVLSSWEPAYPNFVWRAVLPTAMREGTSIAAAIEQAVAPMKWEPRMPTRLDPRRLPTALHPSFFEAVPGELIAIGQRMAWKFREPEWIQRNRPLVHGEAFYTIPPFVPAAEHECVELIDDSFGVPALIQQVFTAPSLLEEGLTVPKLIDQDLC